MLPALGHSLIPQIAPQRTVNLDITSKMCAGVHCRLAKRKAVLCLGRLGPLPIGAGDLDRLTYGVAWALVTCSAWLEAGSFDGEAGYDVAFVEDGDTVGVLAGAASGSRGVDDYLGVLSGGPGGSWDRSRLVGQFGVSRRVVDAKTGVCPGSFGDIAPQLCHVVDVADSVENATVGGLVLELPRDVLGVGILLPVRLEDLIAEVKPGVVNPEPGVSCFVVDGNVWE